MITCTISSSVMGIGSPITAFPRINPPTYVSNLLKSLPSLEVKIGKN